MFNQTARPTEPVRHRTMYCYPRGETIVEAPASEACILRADLDLREIDLARASLPLLGDLGAVLPGLVPRRRTSAAARRPRCSPSLKRRPARRCAPGIDAAVAADWLVAFLRDELTVRRSMGRAVIGLSGGIDSAVTAYLCARALGPENVYAFRLPYRTSSASSLADAQLVVDALGINERTIDISGAVDGYLQYEPDADARRRGNVMARTRMLVLFDQSAKLDALPVGTGKQDRTAARAISLGMRTTRRRSIRSATCSRRRSGRSRAISAFRNR